MGYTPAIYGVIHAVIDASCVMAVYSATRMHDLPWEKAFYLVVGYDVLAFGSQFALGWVTDKMQAPRTALLTGIAATALAVAALPLQPWATMALASLGNALYHVGAGAFSLYASPGRAAGPGIFVAPGALGLALGMRIGKSGTAAAWPFLAALFVALLVAWFVKNPVIPYREPPRGPRIDGAYLIVLLLLFSVFIRSFIGFAGPYDCPKTQVLLFGLPLAGFTGKALGGVISDRLGWIPASVGALVLSAPLIAFGGKYPLVLVGGMLLFQMTMPVTLTATARLFPVMPAFAFGLPCLALIIGAVPTFYEPVKRYYNHPAFFVLILASAAALYLALRLFRGAVPMKFAPNNSASEES